MSAQCHSAHRAKRMEPILPKLARKPQGQIPIPIPIPSPRLVIHNSPAAIPLPQTVKSVTPSYNVEVLTPTTTPQPSPIPIPMPTTPRMLTSDLLAPGSTTPLVLPKIGKTPRSTSIEPDEINPWIHIPQVGSDDINIAGATPLGTIARVPTSDIKPPSTPRMLPSRAPEPLAPLEPDPIINASIYLNLTQDESYDYVANRMRELTAAATDLRKQYQNELQPLPSVSHHGCDPVSSDEFEEYLSIYENNQVYYQDRIDDGSLTSSEISRCLTALEQWFTSIREPSDNLDPQGYAQRQQNLADTGISAYCDPELYRYITIRK